MYTTDMTTFWFGFVGLSLASLGISLVASKFRREDRFHALIALAVTSIATISYFALARGQADITIGGDVVVYGRYLDWLFTTPLLLSLRSLHCRRLSVGYSDDCDRFVRRLGNKLARYRRLVPSCPLLNVRRGSAPSFCAQ